MASPYDQIPQWKINRIEELLKKGLSYEPIAERLGINIGSVALRAKKFGLARGKPLVRWSAEEDAALAKLLDEGVTASQAADEMNKRFERNFTRGGLISRAKRLKRRFRNHRRA